MNRIALCGILVGFSALGLAQDLTKKISVDIPASRASAAFAVLSKAAGVTLEPAGNLRDEVFVVSAHDQTVDDIMKRIAQAESGKWVLQGGGYLLTRESSTTVEQERAEIRARAEAISKAIAKLSASVGNQAPFSKTDAQKLTDEAKRLTDKIADGSFNGQINLASATQKTPASRAIAKLLAGLDPAKLAAIGPNQRVVFSTNPTMMQKSFGNGGYRAFTDFVNEQILYTQTYNANQPPQDGNSRMVIVNGFGTPTMGNGDPKLGLGVGLLIVQRRSDLTLSIDLIAADTNYENLASGSYALQLPRPDVAKIEAGSEEALKISEESKEMAKAIGTGAGSAGAPGKPMMVRAFSSGGGGDFTVSTADTGSDSNIKISAGLRAKVLNPEKYEPLSFVPGEAMLALGRQSNKNIVALLPDYCFGSLTRQFANEVTPSQLLASLAPTHSLVAQQDESWIVVSPGMPYSGRARTISRSALGNLLRTLDKTGTLRLDDVCNFAGATNKVPGLNDFDTLYPRLINDSATNRQIMPLAMGSFSLYKFYGSLSSGQRQAVGSGQQIPFSSFSSQQLDLIADMLYNSPQGPNIQQDQPQGANQSVTTTLSVFSASPGAQGMPMFFGGGNSAKTERTIVVPNGVNNDGFIVGTAKSQPITQAFNSQSGSSSFLDASNLAFSKGGAGQNQLAGYTPPQYDKYRMAQQMNISFRFMFSPRVSMSRSLSDVTFDSSVQPGPYESLPADFRQQVDQLAQQMQRAFDKIPGRGQGAPPPSK